MRPFRPSFLARLAGGLLLTACVALARAADATPDVITLQAEASYLDANSQPVTLQSNEVSTTVSVGPPRITFYTDATYSQTATTAGFGRTLYLDIKAAGCNFHTGKAEVVTVDIWSQTLQRQLTVTATETGPDTGEFRFTLSTGTETATWQASAAPQIGSAAPPPMVPAVRNDVLQAQIEGCGTGLAAAQILIDPSGVVFDSASNLPITGAVVQMIDVTGDGNGGFAGQAARVFAYDGVTPAPSTVTTGSDGTYSFPLVAPSQYRLQVTPPSEWKYPSTHAAASLPTDRRIHLTGSFDGPFPVNLSTGDMFIDLPVDEVPHGMSVTKTASRATAEIAESIGYTVVVRNVGNTELDSVTLQDTLPTGFTYLPRSTTVDGQAADDPTGRRGGVLSFSVPSMAVGQQRTLRYRASVGVLALQGDGVNRAQASSALPFATVSNVAAASVQVQQGVFTDRAMVLGKVFADCNANGLQDAGEVGIPGVRLVMEDGSFVVTDGQGRYSFYGISPRTHVLKLDATTLPPGATPLALSSRNAGDGASRFVDPRRGELHRADFPLGGCSQALSALIALRVSNTNELGSALKMDFRADGGLPTGGDVRAQPASGIVGTAQGSDGTRYVTVQAGGKAAVAVHEEEPTAPAEPTFQDRVAGLDNALGFVDLKDGQALAATQATVRVKGSSQVQLALLVDGKPVGDERVGTRVQDESRQFQARDYVGVPLPAGDHELAVVARDGFGNERGRARVTVRAPGDLARLSFELPKAGVPADGQTQATVVLTLADARGVPVMARTAVTLESSQGEWDATDLDPRVAGVQVFVEGGRAEFHLRSPQAPASAELRASSDKVSTKATLEFVPALRPLIAAGIVEGAFNLRRLSANSITAAGADDGFEDQLNTFATNGTGNNSTSGRAALYLKGKVLGSSLLTVGYDSAKESNQSLFRDIQPDQFYPVYGDSSTKGFDAQSTSHLYVRLEHGKSYLLLGDFTTQSDDPARQLGAYQRSLTGAKAHVEAGPVSATAWASKATSRLAVDEIPADGTSGPFMLPHGAPVANSEKVEVLVRDRNQPALVLSATTLARQSDYDLDVLTGRLLLRAPVASYDADMNPQSIRVSYESATGWTGFVVAGADARVKAGDKAEVGIALVMDQDPLDSMKMASVNATIRPDEHSTLTVEAARTDRDLEGIGDAQRIEFKHEDERLKIAALAAHTDANFENPSSTISKGRNEAALKASYGLGDKTRLVVDAASSGDATSGDRRNGLLVGVEHGLEGGAKVEVGARHVQDRPGADTTTGTAGNTSTVRAKVSAPVPGVANATAFVEAEQDVHDGDKHLLAVGGDYRLTPSSRVYLRQEVVSSLTGELDLDAAQHRNTTLFGVDSDVTRDTHLFSEYRVRDAIDGREAQAAMGLKNQWRLAEGVRLNTSFERVRALDGSDANDNLAVTAAIEYTRDPLTKATGRIELRNSTGSRGALSTLGLARKIDEDWTLLARNAYALTESRTGGASVLQERFQLGVAYRDTRTNRVNGLARYEFKREDNGTDFERRTVHVVSSHADLQLSRGAILTGEYAAKRDIELVDGRWIAGNAQLVAVRATRDVGERWDIGVAARVLANASFSTRTGSVGAELGYRAVDNLWVSLGYNISGFRDRDLADDSTTAAGVYMRMRFKFDESVFGGKPDCCPRNAQ